MILFKQISCEAYGPTVTPCFASKRPYVAKLKALLVVVLPLLVLIFGSVTNNALAQKQADALVIVDKAIAAYAKTKSFSANYRIESEFTNINQTGYDEGTLLCAKNPNMDDYCALFFDMSSARMPLRSAFAGNNLVQFDMNSKNARLLNKVDSVKLAQHLGTLDFINVFRFLAIAKSNVLTDLKNDIGGSLVVREDDVLNDNTKCIVLHRVKKAGDRTIEQTFYLNKKTYLIHKVIEKTCKFGNSCQTLTFWLSNVSYKTDKAYFSKFKVPEDYKQQLLN